MEYNKIIPLLEEKLALSQEQLERIKGQEAPSAIDIDLFLKHLRDCYEMGLKLDSTSAEEGKPESTTEEEKAIQQDDEAVSEEEFDPSAMADEVSLGNQEEEPIAGTEIEETASEVPQDSPEPNSVPHESTLTKEGENAKKNEAYDTPPKNEEPLQSNEQASSSTPLHEKFRNQAHSSLNDQLKQRQQNKALADKWQLSPIQDLKAAIKLNDRQSFIKDLFKGDTEAYREVVKHINEDLSSYSEALNYLEQTIKPTYNWNEESETTAKFVELVYRRFLG